MPPLAPVSTRTCVRLLGLTALAAAYCSSPPLLHPPCPPQNTHVPLLSSMRGFSRERESPILPPLQWRWTRRPWPLGRPCWPCASSRPLWGAVACASRPKRRAQSVALSSARPSTRASCCRAPFLMRCMCVRVLGGRLGARPVGVWERFAQGRDGGWAHP